MPGEKRAITTSTDTFRWETVTGPKGQKAQLRNVMYFVDDVVPPSAASRRSLSCVVGADTRGCSNSGISRRLRMQRRRVNGTMPMGAT